MENALPNSESGDAPCAGGPTSSRNRRARRWISICVAVILLLLLFLPTFLSCPLGRPLLVGYANDQLNGHAEIRDCSIGWFAGLRIEGLVVTDASGRQIMQASRVNSGLQFLDLLEGKFRFHQVHAAGLDLLLSRGPDGPLNWERLLRADSAWRAAAARTPPTGELFVTSGSATYEDDTGQPPVFLRSMTAYLDLPPAGGTITAKLGAQGQIGSLTSGQVLWDGSIRPVSDRSPRMFQQLITKGLDPAVVSRRLGPEWTLQSQANLEARFVTGRGEASPATAASRPGQSNDLVGTRPTR